MLSVAIVCRDNERTIGRTLESVRGLATEIIAVDSGSTDGTVGLLERHNAMIVRTRWKGYVATKQLALEACTQEWVLCLDSDESVEPDLRVALEWVLARNEASPDGYTINRKVYYRGRPLNFAWQPERRVRLVRRGRARWGGLDPHDALEVQGRIGALAGTLRHDSVGTWGEFLEKQAQHSVLMAASMWRQGQRGSLLRLLTSPVSAVLKQLVLKQAWRDGWPGWLAAASTGASALMKHAALIELSRTSSSEVDNSADPA